MKTFLVTRHSPLVTRHCRAAAPSLPRSGPVIAAQRPRHCRAAALSLAFAAAAALAVANAQAQVTLPQSFTLTYGWNAIYIEVSPTQPLDEVFASWPVETVGFYDPASFLSTRQFGDGIDPVGLSMQPVAQWHRSYPEASDAERIPAGSVAVLFSTNAAATAVSLRGVPAAPRMTWHVTDANDVYNFVGFSLQSGASVPPADYLAGFDGDFTKSGFLKISGRTAGRSPDFTSVYASDKVRDGDVRLAASNAQSDWSGALFVSPMNGIDFGTDASTASFSVRNDGAGPRTVAVDLLTRSQAGATAVPAWGDFDLPTDAVYVRDSDVARTNAAWSPLPLPVISPALTKRLDAGETWRLEFGLDRRAFPDGLPKGSSFGMLLRVTDVDGASRMRADAPFVGAASGTDAVGTAWPSGLWIADVAFDHVRAPGSAQETETGGTAKIRLPVHIDEHGTVRLLQRVVAAGTADADGNWTYRLYAGSAAVPTTASEVMRISAVTLPTETPVIPAASGGDDFASGDIAFEFTVAGDGATSLLRHPLHPQHDGLRWDFETPTPSGDDFQNYKGDVKPETFSVSCRIELALETNDGGTAWNPENAKTGTCRWTFNGLMRQGAVTLSGPMTLKRVSPYAELVLE